MEQTAKFKVDTSKCIGCKKCLNVCPGNMVGGDVLRFVDNHPVMVDESNFGWKGCWKCEHCLAVCPTNAISILGINPNEVTPKPSKNIEEDLYNLMNYRRSCRDFLKKDVDPTIINKLLEAVSAAPTGGNNRSLEFVTIESRKKMEELYIIVFPSHQATLFEEDDDLSMLRIYDAPNLFIAHKPVSSRFEDGALLEIGIATSYFELIANAYGLGTIITTYAAELISKNKNALRFLNIPEDHRILAVVGFGYPKYPYSRGVKKTKKINRIK